MEARVITLILESGNGHKTINTGAETLGELKAALRENDIDYKGKTFREGLSRTELIDDSSLLPRDVEWKGAKTNNLVFTLITQNKKIKSGTMSRADAYTVVRNLGLQEVIKEAFGKNFTQVSTIGLVTFITNWELNSVISEAPKSDKAAVQQDVAPSVCVLRGKFNRLIDILEDEDMISSAQAEELRMGIPVQEAPAEQSPYSEADLAALRM